MANRTCTLCGKPMGILDSTTSYYDASGNPVEVHTACKNRQATMKVAGIQVEFYQPTTDDEDAEDEFMPRVLLAAAGVGAVLLIALLWE